MVRSIKQRNRDKVNWDCALLFPKTKGLKSKGVTKKKETISGSICRSGEIQKKATSLPPRYGHLEKGVSVKRDRGKKWVAELCRQETHVGTK